MRLRSMHDALPELSEDLWTRIFQHLKPAVADLGDATLTLDNVASDICVFQSLQQVCKQFRDVFLSNRDWYALMCLPDRMSGSSLASVQHWSARHKNELVDLRILSPDGFAAVTAIAALSGTCSCADNSLVFSSKDCLLAAFTALRTCSFDHIAAYNRHGLDLGIMQSLHHLHNLELKIGCSWNLHLLQHITMLVLDNVDVEASKNCSFTSKLQCLDLKRSTLRGLHCDGIAACQHLQLFRCISSEVMALADIDVLSTNYSFTHIPTTMSKLVALEHLQLAMAPSMSLSEDEIVDLQWLSNMTNLKKLLILPSDLCKFPSGRSGLPKLQEWWSACSMSGMKLLDIEWQVYCSLEQVHFMGCVKLDAHALHQLASIEALSQVCVHLYAGEQESLAYYSSIAEEFMQRSPRVKFYVRHLPAQPAFFRHSIATFNPI